MMGCPGELASPLYLYFYSRSHEPIKPVISAAVCTAFPGLALITKSGSGGEGGPNET